MDKQRISIVIQDVINEAALIEFLQKLKPTSVVVLSDENRLKRILEAVPEIEVGAIRWLYNDERGEADGRLHELGSRPLSWLTDKWYASGLHGNSRAYLYVGNEPAPANVEACVKWYVWASQTLRSQNIRAVMMNAQPAVFEKNLVDVGLFDPFIREMSDGYHVWGWHEYGGPILPLATNGGNKYSMLDKALSQPDKWPTFDQVRYGDISDNWLIGRIYWWDDRAKTIGAPVARKLITEAGQDRLDVYSDIYDNLQRRYSFSPYVCMRGVNTYKALYNDYYKEVFPDKTFERAVLAMLKWLNSIYDDSIIGINLFLWSPDKYDWDKQYGFDYSRLTELHTLLWAWTEELGSMVSIPSDNHGEDVVVSSLDSKTNVRFRSEPVADGKVIGLVQGPVDALMFPDVKPMQSGSKTYNMQLFKIGSQYGWLAQELIRIAPKQADPVVTLPASKVQAVRERVSTLKAKVADLMISVEQLNNLVNDLQ